ncbi:unnamed protein product [Sphacelaria rigidula]
MAYTCLAVDISLLAVLIALHATKKNKNLELVVMALLFSHLIMTTELFLKDADAGDAADAGADAGDAGDAGEEALGAVRAISTFTALQDAKERENNSSSGSSSTTNLRKSVSDREFERMTHNVATQKTHTKEERAKSRSSFFQELFPQEK